MRQHQQIAFRTAYLITGVAADAEDVAQEAFVKAYYALPRFRDGASFRPWLLEIVANEARNRRVATARRERLRLRAALEQRHDPTEPSPETAVLAAEQRAALLAALNQLRDAERLTIAYRYFLDLSELELARVLGCARGTVKSRLSRALGRLRQLVGPSAAGQPNQADSRAKKEEVGRG